MRVDRCVLRRFRSMEWPEWSLARGLLDGLSAWMLRRGRGAICVCAERLSSPVWVFPEMSSHSELGKPFVAGDYCVDDRIEFSLVGRSPSCRTAGIAWSTPTAVLIPECCQNGAEQFEHRVAAQRCDSISEARTATTELRISSLWIRPEIRSIERSGSHRGCEATQFDFLAHRAEVLLRYSAKIQYRAVVRILNVGSGSRTTSPPPGPRRIRATL